MNDIIGYIGTIINTLSTLPQIIKTLKSKDVSGLSISFLICWCVGCGLLLIHTVLNGNYTYPLVINYSFNVIAPFILICLVLKYKK